MRGMADLAMRGPKHAIILASLFAALPMLFWVSAAIVSLVVLRRGVAQGAKVFAWALAVCYRLGSTGASIHNYRINQHDTARSGASPNRFLAKKPYWHCANWCDHCTFICTVCTKCHCSNG